MMNFSIFYGLCDSINVKILKRSSIWGFGSCLAILEDLDRQHAKQLDEGIVQSLLFSLFR